LFDSNFFYKSGKVPENPESSLKRIADDKRSDIPLKVENDENVKPSDRNKRISRVDDKDFSGEKVHVSLGHEPALTELEDEGSHGFKGVETHMHASSRSQYDVVRHLQLYSYSSDNIFERLQREVLGWSQYSELLGSKDGT